MKKLFLTTLLTVLGSASVNAAMLCDDLCTVTIDFPDGGTLKALEPMTITFGDDAWVNATPYSSGDSLFLDTDEELTFDTDGFIDIGDAGNIEYGSLEFSTPSEFVMTVVAVGETEVVTLENFTIIGGAVFEVEAENVVVGDIESEGDLTISNSAGNLSIGSVSGQNVTLDAGLNILDIGGVEIDSCSALGVEGSSVTISTGEGFELEDTGSSSSCVVSGGVNIDVGGVYPIDGEANLNESVNPDEEQEDSGATTSFYLFLLSSLLFFRNRKLFN